MKARIVWGHELPEDIWIGAADRLAAVAPTIASILEKDNIGGRGKESSEEFLTDMQLAYMAMAYVAKYARDKCRIIPTP